MKTKRKHGVKVTQVVIAEPMKAGQRLLLEHLGFRRVRSEGTRTRYEVGEGGSGRLVDIVSLRSPALLYFNTIWIR